MSMPLKKYHFNFLKSIVSQYIALEKEVMPNPYKVDGFYDKNGEIFVKVLPSGCSQTKDIPLETIISQNYFEYFSSDDKKRLFLFSKNKETLKMTDSYYDRDGKLTRVVIKDIKSGEEKTFSAIEISENEQLINKISPNDLQAITCFSFLDNLKKLH